MQRHGIPTADYETFTDAAQAHAYVDRKGAPIVVKADGLAAGKGVVVAMTAAEAHEAIDFMLLDNRLGVAHNEGGARVVIEEFLQGEEASFIVLCDGSNVAPLATSQDHKRLLDGDAGPNTGGMGAYSPAPVVTPAVHARAMREIILPTMRGMEEDGIPYTGFLYAGLMIDRDGRVKTLEFNCRMGDPETQPIMMRLKSDLFDVLMAATAGTLDQVELEWDRRTALGVVMAAAGYPLDPRKGDVISGLPRGGRRCHGVPRRHRAAGGPAASPAAAACCASRRWPTASRRRSSAPTRWCTASTSTARSTAATSAIAPSIPDAARRHRSQLPAGPAGAHHLGLRGHRRHRLPGRRLGEGARRAAAGRRPHQDPGAGARCSSGRAAASRMCAARGCRLRPRSTAPSWPARPSRRWASRWCSTRATRMRPPCT